MRSANRKSKNTKREQFWLTLVMFGISILITGFLLDKKYWREQIDNHGIETKAYLREKTFVYYKPKQHYFAELTYQTVDGRETFHSKKIKISPQDADKLWDKEPITILYLPANPEKMHPKDPVPNNDFLLWNLIFAFCGLTLLSFIAWRTMEE